eukprot:CFRG6256T1
MTDSLQLGARASGSSFTSNTSQSLKFVEQKEGWCSWCYKNTMQDLAQRNIFTRNVFKCTQCHKRTLACRISSVSGCKGMARGHDSWDDELCSVCEKRIPDWSHPPPKSPHGYCSWCYRYTTHTHIQSNLIRRNRSECSHCGNTTVPCMVLGGCKDFARGNTQVPDTHCALHQNVIDTWVNLENNIAQATARGEVNLVKHDKFESFAKAQKGCSAEALVDGKDFLHEVAIAMENAQSTIMMSFWQLHPYVHMRRDEPNTKFDDSDPFRFDNIIKRKAEQGVKIYVLLWDEPHTWVVNNFSQESANVLRSLHPHNVMVMRHPQHFDPANILWSHHQKYVVVDNIVSFVGGFDVCSGRYDTLAHRLVDTPMKKWPGCDYYNPHQEGILTIDSPYKDSLPRETVARMPWHDISVKVRGPVVDDLVLNFVQRWNHHVVDTKTSLSVPMVEHVSGWIGSGGTDDGDKPPILAMKGEKWDIRRQLDVTTAVADGSSPRRQTTYTVKIESLSNPETVDQHENEVNTPAQFEETRTQVEEATLKSVKTSVNIPSKEQTGTCTIQAVRSLGHWSAGIATESSIYGAYMKAIEQAEHYIYIENQYFVSSIAGGGVENDICKAILNKIVEKIEKNEVFRVFVIIPTPENRGEEAKGILKWQTMTLSQGGHSLIEQLLERRPEITDVTKYISLNFLRQCDTFPSGGYITEKVFVHSKIMIVDDNVAIISSANINDRSMLGNRDSELGVVIHDTDRVAGAMNGTGIKTARFAQDLRMRLMGEHLGWLDLDGQVTGEREGVVQSVRVGVDVDDVAGGGGGVNVGVGMGVVVGDTVGDKERRKALLLDPISPGFYCDVWLRTAQRNTDIVNEVFQGIVCDAHTTWTDFSVAWDVPANNDKVHLLSGFKGLLTMYPVDFLRDDNLETYGVLLIGDIMFQ